MKATLVEFISFVGGLLLILLALALSLLVPLAAIKYLFS